MTVKELVEVLSPPDLLIVMSGLTGDSSIEECKTYFIAVQNELLGGKLMCDMSVEDQLNLPDVDSFVGTGSSGARKVVLGEIIKKLLKLSFYLSKNMVCNNGMNQLEEMMMLKMETMMAGVQETLLMKVAQVEEKLTSLSPESKVTDNTQQDEKPEPKKYFKLLVEKPGEIPITETEWTTAGREMKSKMNDVKVDKVSLTQKGNVTMKLADESSIAKTTEVLQQAGYNVKNISKDNEPTILPKIKIIDIDQEMFPSENADKPAKEREQKKRDLVVAFMAKNDAFKSFMEQRHEDRDKEDEDDVKEMDFAALGFKVIYMDKKGGSVIVQVSPEVRDFLKTVKDKLYLGYNACKIYNHFRLTQCYHCQGFGHMSTDCPKDPSACMFCSKGGHRSKDCNHKHERSKHSCVNCKTSNDSYNRRNANTHNASSDLCPMVVHETLILMAKTIGGGESKNYYLSQLKKKRDRQHQSQKR